jgi:hypothetical protein
VRTNAGIIYSESQRLTHLINDVLDLAKIEAGRVDWRMAPLSVAEVLERAAQATQGLFDQKPDVHLVVEAPPGLPNLVGDRDRLTQVAINLISNAVKFTPAGEVRMALARESDPEVGDALVVRVRDTGVGIAPEDHATVFEQFRQVGDTLTDKPQGTGLGLPICKQIVEHHGGRMWLESALGAGSTFAFALPLARRCGSSRTRRGRGGRGCERRPTPPRARVRAWTRRRRSEGAAAGASDGRAASSARPSGRPRRRCAAASRRWCAARCRGAKSRRRDARARRRRRPADPGAAAPGARGGRSRGARGRRRARGARRRRRPTPRPGRARRDDAGADRLRRRRRAQERPGDGVACRS